MGAGGGTLEVFDPAVLMQSIATARQTGILEITRSDGARFWSYVENGKILKARLAMLTAINHV